MSEKKSIFESGFMLWLNKAGQKIGSNKFITALQQGMMGSMDQSWLVLLRKS